jgi:hypothetical protein
MDHCSHFPAPTHEAAVKEVIAECIKKYQGQETQLKEITERVISEMPSLGSYTGWYVGFKPDAIKKVTDQMDIYVKLNTFCSELIYH